MGSVSSQQEGFRAGSSYLEWEAERAPCGVGGGHRLRSSFPWDVSCPAWVPRVNGLAWHRGEVTEEDVVLET